MSNIKLENELKKIGVSDKEAKVYLALLELGQAKVQDVSKKAKVNRATTYVILESLKKQGMVTAIDKDGKVLFIAENPRAFLRIFKEQEHALQVKQEEFKKAMPEFEALFNQSTEKPSVRFFEGKEGVRAIRQEILSLGKEVIYNIYSKEYVDQIRALFPEEENDEFYNKEKEIGITIRSIYAAEPNQIIQFKLKGERRMILKEKFPISSDILILGNKVAFTTLKGRVVSIIIESKELANTIKTIFELAWLGTDKN